MSELMSDSPWLPPVYLFRAGRESVNTLDYRHDARLLTHPRRILIKRTLTGTGTLYVRRRRLSVPAGWAFAIERPGPYAYAFEEPAEPWRFEYLTIGLHLTGPLLPPALQEHPRLCLDEQPDLGEELTRLVDMRLAPDHVEDLLGSAMAYRFLLGFVAAKLGMNARPSQDPVTRFKRLLEAHFTEAFTIADFAQAVGYTVEAMTRRFREQYGMPPRRFVNGLRIRRACQLIEGGAFSLKDVARRCGFSSGNYFGRVFRALVGLSPGEYQKNPDPLRPGVLPISMSGSTPYPIPRL